MSGNYTHEGTPIIVGGDELKIYHGGLVIKNMFDPRTNKWDAGKHWGTMKLIDAKTDFTTDGFLMFNWEEIVNKDLVINEQFNVSHIDMEVLEMNSRFLHAVIDMHDFLVDDNNIKVYEPVKCEFNTKDINCLYYKGIQFTAPARWSKEIGIRHIDNSSYKDALNSQHIFEYDPALKEQKWHRGSLANINKAVELYKEAVPNIPIRHRRKKGE
jgi:hypothetical protein